MPFQMLSHNQNILSGGISTIAADPESALKYAVTTDSGYSHRGAEPEQPQHHADSVPQPVPARRNGDWGAAFSPDGSQVATADGDGKVRVYNVATGTPVMTLDAGDAEATSVAFSPDGSKIAAGYSSGMTRVWEVSTRASADATRRRHRPGQRGAVQP